jgi:hypothetical protein
LSGRQKAVVLDAGEVAAKRKRRARDGRMNGDQVMPGIITASLLLAAATLLPPAANPLSEEEMISYLAQSVCLDQMGRPIPLLPIDPACNNHRPQTSNDTATYRKHDFPDRSDPRAPLLGYQASDSVVKPDGSHIVVVQTFDFGDTHRVFGRFDAGEGDGGQALLLVNGWATAAMTEDGGDGVQYFVSDECRTSAKLERHFLGWLMFRSDVTQDRWRDQATNLNKARNPDDCPAHFNAAYTRYRMASLEFPFRVVDGNESLKSEGYPLDVIISEHYGGKTITTADHFERFYFAKNLGLIRWERWSRHRDMDEPAALFARSGRCPRLDMEETPDRDWRLVDCRTWTTMVLQHAAWSVAEFRWEALERLGILDDAGAGR